MADLTADEMITYKYAKVGGPPNEWWFCRVFLDGKAMKEVVEANAEEGWLIRFTGQAKNNELVTERLTGKVEIWGRV